MRVCVCACLLLSDIGPGRPLDCCGFFLGRSASPGFLDIGINKKRRKNTALVPFVLSSTRTRSTAAVSARALPGRRREFLNKRVKTFPNDDNDGHSVYHNNGLTSKQPLHAITVQNSVCASILTLHIYIDVSSHTHKHTYSHTFTFTRLHLCFCVFATSLPAMSVRLYYLM